MSDQELKNIWQNADDGDNINLDIQQLVKHLEEKMTETDRNLLFRDAREIGASIFVICFFGYKAITEEIVIIQIVSALIVIWAAYVIYRMLDVRKYKKMANLNQSLKAQLMQQKMYLQQQAYLLDSALYWYIAPIAILSTAFIVGLDYTHAIDWVGIALYVVVILAGSYGLYVLNKKAAQITFIPLITNIDTVLVQLSKDKI